MECCRRLTIEQEVPVAEGVRVTLHTYRFSSGFVAQSDAPREIGCFGRTVQRCSFLRAHGVLTNSDSEKWICATLTRKRAHARRCEGITYMWGLGIVMVRDFLL